MLSLANHYSSLPVAYRLYLPKEWEEDGERRRKAGVPDDVTFEAKNGKAGRAPGRLAVLRWHWLRSTVILLSCRGEHSLSSGRLLARPQP